MGKVEWIKVSTGLFDHWKIRHILTHRSGEIMVLLWLRLLILAGQLNKRGVLALSDTVPYDAETLSKTFGKSKKLMTDTLQLFQELSMIHVSEDGFISIAGWEEHQNIDGMETIREKSRQRQAKYRKRQREMKEAQRNEIITLHNAREEERDLDKDKDSIHLPPPLLLGDEGRMCDKLTSQEGMRLRYMEGKLGQGLVRISDEQFDALCEKLDLEELHHYMEVIAECERKGKSFKRKSHYQAILDMVEADRRV